jgi:sugar/nucleoside kinase (ribokinase family)
MRAYDVYGIGNALVDIEYRVTPDELARLGIDKGVMTLVESDHQQRMMDELHRQQVYRSAGGSAANTVIALSQLGARGFYSCKVADDDLETNGIATNARDCSEPGDTGRCLVMVTEDADRTMCTYLGITGELGRDAIVESALRDSEHLYIEGYLASSPTARDAVSHARTIARDAGTRIALSLSDPNVVRLFRDGLEEFIGDGVDLLFSNEEEALELTGSRDIQAALDGLSRQAERFVVTRGPRPTLVHDGSGVMEVPAGSVRPLDTTGAGDMFAGAFLYALSCDWGLDQATHFANHCAGRLIVEYGPRLPRDTMRELLEEFCVRA